jgi:ribosome-binding protein aMBF1 (putative translation factor)
LITSDQIRAARALLKWSRSDLSEKSGVGFSGLLRLESADGIPNSHVKTLEALKKLLKMLELSSSAHQIRKLGFVGNYEAKQGCAP